MPAGPSLLRLIDDADVKCPAGCPALAGTGVLCRITEVPLPAREQPSSLKSYCLNESGHRTCPIWQDDKERTWSDRPTALAEDGGTPSRPVVVGEPLKREWSPA